MKRILLAAVGVAALAGSAAAQAAPVAVGKEEWSLTRGEQVSAQKPNALTGLQAGDVVAAAGSAVRVTASESASEVLVSPESKVALESAAKWQLLDGGAAVSTKDAGTMNFGTLAVAPLAGGDKGTMYVVRRMGENTVSVQGFENRVAVRDAATETQLAVVGPGDRMVFTREGEAWKSNLATQGQAGIFRMQSQNEDEVASSDEDKKSDRRRGAIIVGGAVGVAGAAGALYYISTDDDSKGKDDDDQKPQTGTQPN